MKQRPQAKPFSRLGFLIKLILARVFLLLGGFLTNFCRITDKGAGQNLWAHETALQIIYYALVVTLTKNFCCFLSNQS